MGMRTFEVEGCRVAARVEGRGPEVLLLHGLPGSSGVFDAVVADLASAHRCIVPDLVGFGASDRTDDVERLWAAGQARVVAQVLDQLDARDVLVVAHDFGGPVAALMLASTPERFRGLVLAATNAFPDTPIPFPLSGIFLPGVGRLVERALFSRASLAMMVRQGGAAPGFALRPEVHLGDEGQVRTIGRIFGTALRALDTRYRPVHDALARVAVPSVVLWGDRDPFFPVEVGRRTAALVPGARFVILERTGHFVPEERPQAVVDAVRTLAGRPGTGAFGGP